MTDKTKFFVLLGLLAASLALLWYLDSNAQNILLG
jgi:hypothetical protein